MALFAFLPAAHAQSTAQTQVPIALGTTNTIGGVGILGNIPAAGLCDTCYNTGTHPVGTPFVVPVDITQLPVGTRPTNPILSNFAVTIGGAGGTNVGQPENVTTKSSTFCLGASAGQCGGARAPANYLGWSLLVRNGTTAAVSSNNYGVFVGGAIGPNGGSKLGLYESYVNVVGNFGAGVAIQAGTVQATRSTIAIVGDRSPGVMVDGANSLFSSFTGNLITSSGNQSSGFQVTNGARVQLNTDTVNSAGTLAHGLYGSGAGSTIAATASTISSNGQDAHALFVQNGAAATLANTALTAAGAGGFGVYATGTGSTATLTGGAVTAQGSGGQGLQAELGGNIAADGVVLHTLGAQGYGATVRSGGSLSLTNMTVTVDGSNAAGLFATGTGTGNGATLNQVTLVTPQSPSIAADGGSSTITLNNSTASGNNGTWLNIASADPAHPTSISITANSTSLQGAAVTDTLSTSTVTLAGGSTWTMTGSSDVTNLVNGPSLIQYTPPVGDPTQLASYKTLTVANYVGMGGGIGLNTYLGDDRSPSDRLIIRGGTGTGTSPLFIANTTGHGALTLADGILVVDAQNGATTVPGAFTLGNRVAAGAFEYSLHRGGASNGESWFLRSEIVPTPPGPVPPGPEPVPDFRNEVPVDIALPALGNRLGLGTLGTYHDRIGDEYPAVVQPAEPITCKAPSKDGGCAVPAAFAEAPRSAAWGRLFGESGSVSFDAANPAGAVNNIVDHGPSYDFAMYGLQAGMDLLRRLNEDGSRDVAGFYIGVGRASADVDAVHGGPAGTSSVNGYSLGGYWTRIAEKGWYVDTVLQATWYDAEGDAEGRGPFSGESFAADGWGLAASLESGYPFDLGYGWSVEPQAQLVYQHVSLDDGADAFGRIDYDATDALYGRLGARLTRNWLTASGKRMIAWGRADVWSGFGASATTIFSGLAGGNPVAFNTDIGGTWGSVGLGLQGEVAKNLTMFASGDYNFGLGGDGDFDSWSGRIGMKVKW